RHTGATRCDGGGGRGRAGGCCVLHRNGATTVDSDTVAAWRGTHRIRRPDSRRDVGVRLWAVASEGLSGPAGRPHLPDPARTLLLRTASGRHAIRPASATRLDRLRRPAWTIRPAGPREPWNQNRIRPARRG